ncbi:MAG: hypothetical protein ACR2MY_09070 [Candidatus Dormibacteria bacterium]
MTREQVGGIGTLAARALCAVALAGACAVAVPGTVRAASPDPATCLGVLPGALPPTEPGPIRFGTNPRVQAGQVGPVPATAVPVDPARQLGALATLSGGGPFVLRLNRVFWPAPAGQQELLDQDVRRYSDAGYLIELQLRYHPASPATPDPAAFAAWAAGMVHRYDRGSHLVSVQVTNEVNFSISQDSSDGAFSGAKDALIQGVEKAKQQVQSDGTPEVKVGFNWFYRTDGQTEKGFWGYLASNGGPKFASALDWVGLDAYPGTFFPPAEPAPNGYYGGMVNALSVLHNCFMPNGGVPGKPIYIEETGYPTDLAARTEANQLEAVKELTAAVHDYGHLYNVTDFRWFNLRDADSSSPNFQQHFGLLNSDYSRKPAFCAYRQAVTGRADCPADALTPAAPTASPATPPHAGGGGLPLTSGAPRFGGLALVALGTGMALALGMRRNRRGQPQTLGQSFRSRR